MAEHRVPMLGAALRRYPDPERSRDPQIRELVAALSGLEVAPPPGADFRAELRAQLVAVAPRLVEEGDSAPATVTPAQAALKSTKTAKSAKPATSASRPSGFRFAKPLIATASVLVAFIVLLGGTVLLSREALPGDALYNVKRASENTQYGLTGGARAKGKLKLEFAGRRIGEVSSLLPRASALAAGTGVMADSGEINSSTSTLVQQTLASADSDVFTGSRLLTGAAVRSKSRSPLDTITHWTPGEVTALNKIIARIPSTGPLHAQALTSLNLIEAVQQRAAMLKSELNCGCLGSQTDRFGPVPCTTGCPSKSGPGVPKGTPSSRSPGSTGTTRPSTPSQPDGQPKRTDTHSTTPSSGRGASDGASSSTDGGRSVPGAGVVPTTPKLPGLPTPSGLPKVPTLPRLPTTMSTLSTRLPTLPAALPTITPPVTVKSSCISVAIGGILHAGTC